MCKVLTFYLAHRSYSHNREEIEREEAQNVMNMEREINRWLQNGWKLSQTAYDKNTGLLLVFMEK